MAMGRCPGIGRMPYVTGLKAPCLPLNLRIWHDEESKMKTASFQAGMMLAALMLVMILALEGPGLGKKAGLIEDSDADAVLVFVIPNASAARKVRAAFKPDRILWQGPTGLALVGERVVASSLDGASDVIMKAGWIERPIRIVQLDGGFDGSGGSASGAASGDRTKRLRELTRKPKLTRGEQMFILSAMSDGVAI